jgi:hypothetical protein
MSYRVLALLTFLLMPAVAFAAGTPAERPDSQAAKVEDAVERDHEFDAGSNIAISRVSRVQAENLALLAKVWGFLKYHHPRITAGEISWDYELFRVMPAVLSADSHFRAQEVLSNWILGLGVTAPCQRCAQLPASSQLHPDIGWIHNRKLLGKNLSRQLDAIYRNRPASSAQYYVSFYEDGNARFDRERSYDGSAFPDAGYRLLGLFRYWNVIEYWFPYRNLINDDWDDVLKQFIPRFASANNQNDYVLGVAALAASIHDGHAAVSAALDRRPPVGDCRLPVAVRFVEGHYVVQWCKSADGTSGLLVGDSVIALDGTPVEKMIKMLSPYYPASNEAWRRHSISFSLLNGPAGPSLVTVKRDGRFIDVNSSRQPRAGMPAWEGSQHDLPGPIFRKLSDDVGYIWYGLLKPGDVTSCIQQALGTRCLLIDIRAYPNDFPAFELGSHLVTKPTPHSCFTYPDSTNPGSFVWTQPEALIPAAPHYNGKVAILVDETTLSRGEYSALVLRASPNAIVVGSTTAGADGNVSTVPLPGGVNATMSGIGVFYPDHSPTQQIGIVPDIVVHPTIAGLREQRDEVAETAVRRLTGEKLTIHNRYFGQ